MYDPIKDGIEKTAQSVRYTVVKPPPHLSSVVHSYWELKTEQTLNEDFLLHAIPDACVNLLFNQIEPDIAAVTALRTHHEVLNLGKCFHYVGIQLLPGAWQGNTREIAHQFVGTAYEGELPLVSVSRALMGCQFSDKQGLMSALVEQLIGNGFVIANPVTELILSKLDQIKTVTDMANLVGLSPRQLQRILKKSTGFSPHDLLKILRIQQSFRQNYLELYADQSHYIHSFRKVTGYTPVQFIDKFDV